MRLRQQVTERLLVPDLRAETAGLVRLADRDLRRLFARVGAGPVAAEALNDLLPGLVTEYGAMGAAVAAEWYDEIRARRGVRGSFRAEPIRASDRGARSLIEWAVVTATSDDALHQLILGGTQRRIADHVRETVASSSIRDASAQGWRRVGSGACDWCQQYLDGEIHYVEGYDFPAHDSCGCSVTPAW